VFDTVRTYPFSKACGHPRGPVGYFLDFLDVDADAFEFVTANESLSINAIRLLEYIDRLEPFILDGEKNPNRSSDDLKALWTVPGPKFRLTWEEYETVREHVEFENAWLESNLGREYCDDEIELRRSDVHWDEEGLRAVRSALPEIPDVLVPYVHRYFEEERGIVLTQDAVVPGLPECRPALERPEEVVRSIDERLRAGQLDEVSAIALLRSVIGDDEGDRLLYDRACELLLESGKSQEAMDLAEEGLARFDDDLALMSRLGYACAAEGETKRALDQWARFRQAHPSAEAGWIEGAMCGASLGFENEAGELLGAYLAQLEDRLSQYWWDRALQAAEAILMEYCENRHVKVLLKALFFWSVAPDLSAHIKLFSSLYKLKIQIWSGQASRKIFDLLKDIYWYSPISRDDDKMIALELALDIAVERENFDRIEEFIEGISFKDFCIIFNLRRTLHAQEDFLREEGDVQKMIAAMPMTCPDNAWKCLALRYGLGMDYGAAYEALVGLSLPTEREAYSDFAFAAYAGNGKPRVAFCISGQLRGYQEAFASWKKSRLFANCDVSIFVHTWPEVGSARRLSGQAHHTFSGNLRKAFIKEWSAMGGAYKFGKVYPNFVRTFTNPCVVSAAELTEFYETPHVVVESEEPYRDCSNCEKMYYKIQACWELACASGEEFHFVFRVRPDLVCFDDSKVDWRGIIERSQNERIVYVDYLRFHIDGLAVGDQLGFGNPAVMAVYSNTWTCEKDPNSLIRTYLDSLIGHIPIALNLIEREVKSAPFPEGFVLSRLLSERLVDSKRPSLNSLHDALEKDLAPNSRHRNTMWRALEEDMSRES